MSANAFSLVYDGPPVAEGTIDARDLAPALLALADLIDEAAPVVDPELPRLSLRVRPDFREGSFEVYLELANLYSKFVSLFSGPDAQAWASFLQIIGIAGVAGVHDVSHGTFFAIFDYVETGCAATFAGIVFWSRNGWNCRDWLFFPSLRLSFHLTNIFVQR